MKPTRSHKTFAQVILGILALVALFFTLPAAAQVVGPNTLTVPASVAATTTNTTYASSNWVGTATQSQKVTLGVKFQLTSTGTSAVVFKFDSSVDGVNWETATHSITGTAAGTTPVNKLGTFDLGGAPYFRLSSIENPNANAVTNISIRYSAKKGT